MTDMPGKIEDLYRHVATTAHESGVADAAEHFACMGPNPRTEDVLDFAAAAMASHDTWSGRTNDIRRSYADGYRQQARRLIRDHARKLVKEAENV